MPGHDSITVSVTTDLDLFAKHHVGIQEGPSLCWTLLMTNTGAPRFALTEADLLAFLSTRVVRPRKAFKRRPTPSNPDGQPESHIQAAVAFGSL
jgi:hypothetical protein